jgi:hypothetical protein
MLNRAFVFIAVSILGVSSALPALIVSSFFIVVMSGFEVLALLQIAEIFVVIYFHRKYHKNMIICSLFFWWVVGFPLSILYLSAINADINVTSLFPIFLVVVNSSFNVLVADVAITYFPWRKLLKSYDNARPSINFTNMALHLCLTSIIFPMTLFLMITNFTAEKQIRNSALRQLKDASEYAEERIKRLNSQEKRSLFLGNALVTYNIGHSLSLYSSASDNAMIFEIYNSKGQLISSTGTTSDKSTLPYWNNPGSLNKISHNYYYWQPQGKHTLSNKDVWCGAMFIHQSIEKVSPR